MRAGFERLYTFLTSPIETLMVLADRERAQPSRSALLEKLGEALATKDPEAVERLAASLGQQTTKKRNGSARSQPSGTPKSVAPKGRGQ